MVLCSSVADYCSLLVLVLDRAHAKQEVSAVPGKYFLYLLSSWAIWSTSGRGRFTGCLSVGFLYLWKHFVGGEEEVTYR